MKQSELEDLVRTASFAADGAAMNERSLGATEAQVTRRIVRRTIEFLVGNDLIEVKSSGADTWLTLDPPYPHPVCTDSSEPLAP